MVGPFLNVTICKVIQRRKLTKLPTPDHAIKAVDDIARDQLILPNDTELPDQITFRRREKSIMVLTDNNIYVNS